MRKLTVSILLATTFLCGCGMHRRCLKMPPRHPRAHGHIVATKN